MKTNNILTIKAGDRPGLLHLLTGVLNRKLIPIISLNAAPTDSRDMVLITMEIDISEKALTPLLFKLENIIEVFAVEAIESAKASCLRAAYFKMDKSILNTPQKTSIQRYGALIVNLYPDAILIAKYGSDLAIRQLYDELDGPLLLGFSQTGLIADSALLAHEDKSSVIERAAWLHAA